MWILVKLRNKVRKDLKHSKSPVQNKFFTWPFTFVDKDAHEKDIENIKQLSYQFGVIDRLMYLFYITSYTDKRHSNRNLIFDRKNSIGMFQQLKLMFANNRQLALNSLAWGKDNLPGNHGYDEKVFEYEDYMKVFLQAYDKYKSLWHQCHIVTIDDWYLVSTKCIETVIEMNSRAGHYQYINEQVKEKHKIYEELQNERDYYKGVSMRHII